MKASNTSSTNNTTGFPVLKVDYQFTLVSSNELALPLLHLISCRPGERLPDTVLNQCPEIIQCLESAIPGDCCMQVGETNIWFDLVPFPEAGYIGLYGYHIGALTANSGASAKMAG